GPAQQQRHRARLLFPPAQQRPEGLQGVGAHPLEEDQQVHVGPPWQVLAPRRGAVQHDARLRQGQAIEVGDEPVQQCLHLFHQKLLPAPPPMPPPPPPNPPYPPPPPPP